MGQANCKVPDGKLSKKIQGEEDLSDTEELQA